MKKFFKSKNRCPNVRGKEMEEEIFKIGIDKSLQKCYNRYKLYRLWYLKDFSPAKADVLKLQQAKGGTNEKIFCQKFGLDYDCCHFRWCACILQLECGTYSRAGHGIYARVKGRAYRRLGDGAFPRIFKYIFL